MSDSPTVADRITTVVRKQWFWAVIAILVLLGINVIQDPTYLRISVNPQNGNLVGNLIDILRASAPIIMIAVGMSLVIATRGIDLSVGSIMVVSGAVSMEFLKSVDTSGSVRRGRHGHRDRPGRQHADRRGQRAADHPARASSRSSAR